MGPEIAKCEMPYWQPALRSVRVRAKYSRVLADVCKEFDVDEDDILGGARTQRETEARHELWFRLRAAGWSFSAIGRETGFDHTTVMAAIRKRVA